MEKSRLLSDRAIGYRNSQDPSIPRIVPASGTPPLSVAVPDRESPSGSYIRVGAPSGSWEATRGYVWRKGGRRRAFCGSLRIVPGTGFKTLAEWPWKPRRQR